MNRHLTAAAGLAAVLLAAAAPAQAHGGVQWSVTVNSSGYAPGYSGYYYPPQPGVTAWPQSNYIYGAPPSAFTPPPPIIYVQPQPVYPPPVIYVQPGRPHHEHRHGWGGGWDNGGGRFRR